MRRKIVKSILVVAATLAASLLFGIIGVGRRYSSIMPANAPANGHIGGALVIIGLLVALATSVFILRYFIFFTRTQVIDAVGNPLTDNSTIAIGSTKVPPIVIASAAALLSMIFIGMGFGMIFDTLTMYILYICSISLVFFVLAAILFLFSVIKHKIRRRFAWIATSLFLAIAVMIFSKAIPSINDLSVSDNELTAVTGTISRTASYSGLLAGPGKTTVVIKGTSGETITLHYSGSYGDLQKNKRYTFYYLPNTKLIDKMVEAESIKY